MKRLLFAALLTAFPALAAPTPFAQTEKLALRAASANRGDVPCYAKFELKLDFRATYQNPFDPDEVQVWADFTGPKGVVRHVNGFLGQEFARKLDNGAEKVDSAGEPRWLIRFAADAPGVWKYRVGAKDRSGQVSLPEASFRATPSQNPGFVRRSKNNPRVFQYDNGKPFFAVGENMGWPGKRGSFDFDDWLGALGKAGGNWMRIWMSSWNCALEWSRESKGEWRSGDYYGVGVYSLGNAWMLDNILDSAEKNGVSTMVCFGTYGEFSTGGFFNEGQWKANPYNVANGGPCADPKDFWTNETARKLYRQRLRYIAARYGWRAGVHSWEFWNEANPPAAWVEEMARYLKGLGQFAGLPADAFGHLISTSYGSDEIWKLPEVDFTQDHHYGTGNIADHAPIIHRLALDNAKYGKPHLTGEFGIDWRDSDAKYDAEGKGVNFHNGLWAGALSGDGGGAMLWWWDNYVHPKNIYGQFTPLRRFSDVVPWTDGEWKPLEMDAPVTEGPETFSDLTVPASSGWGKAKQSDFIVTPLGIKGDAAVTQHLYGPGKADLRTTPVFHVNYAQPGRFTMRVDEVSSKSTLRFVLDGVAVRDVILDPAPPTDPKVKPEYETTEFKAEWNIHQARFNKEYSIEVPKGEHAIRLEAADGDWLSLISLTVENYRSSRSPEMQLYALGNGKSAIFWAHNAAHNWRNVADKKVIAPIRGAQTALRGLPDGRYAVEWWDTWKGEVTARTTFTSKAGVLRLRLPDIATDLAARVTPV